jgi:hypothetical protein
MVGDTALMAARQIVPPPEVRSRRLAGWRNRGEKGSPPATAEVASSAREASGPKPAEGLVPLPTV